MVLTRIEIDDIRPSTLWGDRVYKLPKQSHSSCWAWHINPPTHVSFELYSQTNFYNLKSKSDLLPTLNLSMANVPQVGLSLLHQTLSSQLATANLNSHNSRPNEQTSLKIRCYAQHPANPPLPFAAPENKQNLPSTKWTLTTAIIISAQIAGAQFETIILPQTSAQEGRDVIGGTGSECTG